MIKNEKLRKGIRGVAVVLLAIALYLFGQDAYSNYTHQQENDNLDQIKEEVSEEIIDTTDPGEEKPKPEDIMGTLSFYTKLKETNPDYVGWIYMPGMHIDHPVVMAPDNAYYLNHGFYKSYNKYGTIFVDYRDKEIYDEPHLVIYGHHMVNKSMFSYLDTLRDKQYYTNNKTFEIYTEDGVKKYIIFAVETVNADTTALSLPYTGNIQSLIKTYTKNALYKTGVDTSKATQVITLVTCTALARNYRILVHAIPVNN
jgi:sortase B